MPGGSDIRAGRAFVELFTKDGELVKGLDRAQKHLNDFGDRVRKIGATVAAAGGAFLGPIITAAKIFADAGDGLEEMSQRTGFAVESLSQLRGGLQLAGSDLAGFEGGIRKMQKALNEAATGNKGAAETFSNLGLDAGTLSGMSPEKQFTTIADAISKIEDPTKRAAAAMEVFGKTGTSLLPFIEDGAAGIQAAMADAAKRGQTITAEQAHAAAELADSWGHLTDALKSIAVAIGGAVAPAMTDFTNTITDNLEEVRAWLAENGELILTLTAIAAGTVAVGTAITALSTIFTAASVAVGALSATIGFLASPVGLIVAAVVAIGAGIAYVVEQTVGWSNVWDGIVAIASDVWDQLGPAFKQLGTDITDNLTFAWDLFRAFLSWIDDEFGDVITATGQVIGDVFDTVILAIKIAIQNASTLLKLIAPGVAGIVDAVSSLKADVDAGGGGGLGDRIRAQRKEREDAQIAKKNAELNAALNKQMAAIDAMGEKAAAKQAVAAQTQEDAANRIWESVDVFGQLMDQFESITLDDALNADPNKTPGLSRDDYQQQQSEMNADMMDAENALADSIAEMDAAAREFGDAAANQPELMLEGSEAAAKAILGAQTERDRQLAEIARLAFEEAQRQAQANEYLRQINEASRNAAVLSPLGL